MTTWKYALAAMLTAAVPVHADVAPDPVSAGGNVQLMKGKAGDIRMAREEVNITVHPGFTIVDATFVMVNDGADMTLDVGFPGAGVRMSGRYAEHTALHGFEAQVNGAVVPSRAEPVEHEERAGPPGSPYKRTRKETWHVFSATFPRGREVTLRTRYGVVAQFHREEGTSWDQVPQLDEAWYILHTGATWKGPIGEAVVRITAGPDADKASIQLVNHGKRPGLSSPEKWEPYKLPTGATRIATGIELRWEDMVPTEPDNLEFVWRSDPGKRPIGQWGMDEPRTRALIGEAMKVKGGAGK